MRSLLRDGALGRVVELESRFDRFRPQPKGGWRESAGGGTGILYDLGSHLIDQALLLFGRPNRVFADIAVQRDGVEADDWFRVLLDYPQTRVCLGASCLAAGPMTRFRVRGTEGTWLKHGLDRQESDLAEGRRPGEEGWGREIEESWGVCYGGSDARSTPSVPGLYTEFYRLLAHSVQEGSEPPVTPGEGRDVIRVLELCLESWGTGGWVGWS